MSKEESRCLSGIAILLMIFLHTCGSADTFPKANYYGWLGYLALYGKICVSLFAFISGYGLTEKYKDYKQTSVNPISFFYNFVIKRLYSFYKIFGFVCVAVFLYKITLGQNIDFKEFILNFTGLSFSYDGAWWYIRYYFFMILAIFPLFCLFDNMISKFNLKVEKILIFVFFSALCVIAFFLRYKVPGGVCVFVFLSGIVCSKYELLKYVNNGFISSILFFIGVCIRLTYTNPIGSLGLDLIVVPLIIPFLLFLIEKKEEVYKFFYKLGSFSTFMWLTHGFIIRFSLVKNHVDNYLIGYLLVVGMSYILARLYECLLLKLAIRLNGGYK